MCEVSPSPIVKVSNHLDGKGAGSSMPQSPCPKQIQSPKNKVVLEIWLPVHPDENVDPSGGDGWQMVNSKKKGKGRGSHLKMNLRSQRVKDHGS